MTRVFVCVLDGCGAGELPDAAAYGDVGSDTLGHVLRRSGVELPELAALGLGEVLQAWAGGIRVESLFVDEGFGALDEDTVERAIELLERLPQHARMVGVVSHVPELRKRIPARLEVLRGDHGSFTRCSLRHRAVDR